MTKKKFRDTCLWLAIFIFFVVIAVIINKPKPAHPADKVHPGSYTQYKGAKYIGHIETKFGQFACYLAKDRDINRILCKRFPRFKDMWAGGFADRQRKEIWGESLDIVRYHVDLCDDVTKWMAEQRRDEQQIRERQFERWMQESLHWGGRRR